MYCYTVQLTSQDYSVEGMLAANRRQQCSGGLRVFPTTHC